MAGHLYVFQRTPSTIDVRDQRATTPGGGRGLAQRAGLGAGPPRPVRQAAGRTAPSRRTTTTWRARRRCPQGAARQTSGPRPHPGGADRSGTSRRASGSWSRSATASTPIVDDPKTAAALKPYYPYGCKRPTFHDEYLPTFNRPNVTLVDVAPMGVRRDQRARRRARRRAVRPRRARLRHRLRLHGDLHVQPGDGAGGRTLAEKWQEEGTRTFLGLHTAGFPNLFIVAGPQGAGGSFNFTDAIEEHSDYVVWMLADDARRRPPARRRPQGRRGALGTALRRRRPRHRAVARLPVELQPLRPGRSRARWPTTAARPSERRAEAQETLAPYVFGLADR